jgi:class 3 adenylate cyclase
MTKEILDCLLPGLPIEEIVYVLRDTRSILVKAIEQRGGSVLATPGDFVLATFADVPSAFEAAVAGDCD